MPKTIPFKVIENNHNFNPPVDSKENLLSGDALAEAVNAGGTASGQGDSPACLPGGQARDRLVVAIELHGWVVEYVVTQIFRFQWPDTEDVAQDCWAEITTGWQGKEDRGDEATVGWFRKIAINTCIDHRRRSGRRALLKGSDKLLESVASSADSEPTVTGLAEKERKAVLWEAVETLGEPSRTILVLRFQMGLTISKIADAVDLSETAVKNWVLRSREILRGKLHRLAGEFPPSSLQPQRKGRKQGRSA